MYSRRRFVQIVGLATASAVFSGCDLFKGDIPKPDMQEVHVVLKEWQIIPSKILAKAGKVRFVVRNYGTMDHGFAIEGEINGAKFEDEIEPFAAGKTKTLELELAPGEYKVYCPVPGHDELGMKGELIVQPAGNES